MTLKSNVLLSMNQNSHFVLGYLLSSYACPHTVCALAPVLRCAPAIALDQDVQAFLAAYRVIPVHTNSSKPNTFALPSTTFKGKVKRPRLTKAEQRILRRISEHRAKHFASSSRAAMAQIKAKKAPNLTAWEIEALHNWSLRKKLRMYPDVPMYHPQWLRSFEIPAQSTMHLSEGPAALGLKAQTSSKVWNCLKLFAQKNMPEANHHFSRLPSLASLPSCFDKRNFQTWVLPSIASFRNARPLLDSAIHMSGLQWKFQGPYCQKAKQYLHSRPSLQGQVFQEYSSVHIWIMVFQFYQTTKPFRWQFPRNSACYTYIFSPALCQRPGSPIVPTLLSIATTGRQIWSINGTHLSFSEKGIPWIVLVPTNVCVLDVSALPQCAYINPTTFKPISPLFWRFAFMSMAPVEVNLPSASKAAKVHRTDLFELQAAELANLPEPSSSERLLSEQVFELSAELCTIFSGPTPIPSLHFCWSPASLSCPDCTFATALCPSFPQVSPSCVTALCSP